MASAPAFCPVHSPACGLAVLSIEAACAAPLTCGPPLPLSQQCLSPPFAPKHPPPNGHLVSTFTHCGAPVFSNRAFANDFIARLGLQDPRQYPEQFARLPRRVQLDIFSWNLTTSMPPGLMISALQVHTYGSAIVQKDWPMVPHQAGWGLVFFGLGRVLRGGPVTVSAEDHYHSGACRHASPVAELSAIMLAFKLLRPISCTLPLQW